ncbi:hypothetical protein [Polyangium fumosum]|uniref:hypothetical protein n=1 Tax=Polyangium fumosum TaxID=889272 RepID=UPI0010ADBBA8|nr:hypothetical protein [Polyangium fumosum]
MVGHVALAAEFQNLLDTGDVRSRTELAERFELTRARVTQLLNLLSLAPEVIAFVRALPPGTPARQVTERGLRRLTSLPVAKQIARAKACLPGFAAFLTSSVEPATTRGVERATKRCSGQQR